MNERDKQVLDNLIHTRRITIQKNNVNTTVPRKIMKIKRNIEGSTEGNSDVTTTGNISVTNNVNNNDGN